MKPDLKNEYQRGELDGVPYQVELIHPERWAVQTVTVMLEGRPFTRTPRQHSWSTRAEAMAEALKIVGEMIQRPKR